MAWHRMTVTVEGAAVEGFFRPGSPPEATIPWRHGIAPGAAVEVAGVAYAAVSVRDPGDRHETLELTLAEPQKPPVRPAGKRERLAAIRDTIAGLDPNDPAHFVKIGKPDANVLTELLGWRVTARDRDDAWAAMGDG